MNMDVFVLGTRVIGLDPIRISVEPWPVGDIFGFQVALETLCASQKPG
jgi:hypothetical protein